MSVSRRAAACHVALVATTAGLGGFTENGQFYLAAVVLTLPIGLVALVSVYLARGLLTGVGGLFTGSRLPDGSDPAWLADAGAAANTILFTAAAVGTVFVARRFSARLRVHSAR